MAKQRISTVSPIGDNIARLMEEHPHIKTQTALAAETGIAQSTIGRIIRKEAVPGAENVQKIAAALGATIQAIYGDASPGDGVVKNHRPILTWEHQDELPPGEFALIRRLGVRLSAGKGSENIDVMIDHEHQPQAFRSDWIRKMGLKPSMLASLSADGHSMEPRIQHGDALVIDISQTQVQDGKVYALWYDGGERVKRLYRLPGGGLRIASDNPSYTPIDLQPEHTAHVRVLGRVVHVSGEGGL
jgi:phage repressor protein C with HTH and peptisase S24 domain